MANPDRPNGFTPVKTLSGAPVSSVIRAIGVADGEDIFIGDMVNLESGLADPMATNDAAILGAVVGIGKIVNGQYVSAFDPDNLVPVFYDDSASTHTDYCVFYAPATDCIFEVQSNANLDLVPGSPCDLVDGTGSSTSGRSVQEVGTNTNSDFVVVEIPAYPNNDSTLANTRYWVRVTRAEQAFG